MFFATPSNAQSGTGHSEASHKGLLTKALAVHPPIQIGSAVLDPYPYRLVSYGDGSIPIDTFLVG